MDLAVLLRRLEAKQVLGVQLLGNLREGEPEGTGGIPLQFLNFNTPPLGGASGPAGAADVRRGGGGVGGQFVEPQTRD